MRQILNENNSRTNFLVISFEYPEKKLASIWFKYYVNFD